MKKIAKFFGYAILFSALVHFFPLILLLALYTWVGRKYFGLKRIVITGESDYVFVTTQDLSINTAHIQGFSFEKEFLKIQPDGTVTVKGSFKNGYAWDGCSPKVKIFDLVFGTPDGVIDPVSKLSKTYMASMIHDVLYQYRNDIGAHVTRKQADMIFLELLQSARFELAYPYYRAVRCFGWTYWNA